MPHVEKMTKEDLESCAVVARLFKEHSERYGLTQATLGKMVGKSSKTISAIVNGRMRITVDMGLNFAKAFDVSVTEILPKLAAIDTKSQHAEIIDDLSDLSPENREAARKMIRKLLDSQEDT